VTASEGFHRVTGTVAKANFIVAAIVGAHQVIAAVANNDRVSAGIVGKHRNIVAVTADDCCRWLMSTEAAAGDLEHRAVLVRSTCNRGAEKIAFRVRDQPTFRIGTLDGVGAKADQGGGGVGVAVGGLGDLERRAFAKRPANCCRAEQIASGVGDQPGSGRGTVRAVEVTRVVGALA
jgi:hypothetical protein